MSRVLCLAIAAGLLGGSTAGCNVSPAQRAAIQRAWAEHDAEVAAECRRNGVGFAAGGCVAGGP